MPFPSDAASNTSLITSKRLCLFLSGDSETSELPTAKAISSAFTVFLFAYFAYATAFLETYSA